MVVVTQFHRATIIFVSCFCCCCRCCYSHTCNWTIVEIMWMHYKQCVSNFPFKLSSAHTNTPRACVSNCTNTPRFYVCMCLCILFVSITCANICQLLCISNGRISENISARIYENTYVCTCICMDLCLFVCGYIQYLCLCECMNTFS